MEGNAVQYMTQEEVRSLDPSQIASMTMTSGSVIVVNHDLANMNYYYPQVDYQTNQNVVLRAKKTENVQEDEKVEVVDAQPQEEATNKEVLRGPDGKPLLIDIITGQNLSQPEEQPQVAENTLQEQENSLPPEQSQNTQQIYEQGLNPTNEQEVQEQNVEIDNNVNEEQVAYPPEQNQPIYPPQELNDNNAEVQYVDPNDPNQFQEAYEPVPETNIPGEKKEYLEPNVEYFPDQAPLQEPINMYPEFEDEVPQQAQVVQPEYYPETTPVDGQPVSPLPQEQAQPPVDSEILSPSEMPTQQPIDPQPQIQPSSTPVQQPIKPIFRPLIPGVKGFAPGGVKGPIIKIKYDYGKNNMVMPGMRPKVTTVPLFPQRRPMPPPPPGMRPGNHYGPGFIPPKTIVIKNPIGKMMNVVKKVAAPFVGGVRLRSTNPNVNKNVQQNAGKQEPVLRARRKDNTDYNYYQEEQNLCPECSEEELNNTYGYSQYGENYSSQSYQNQPKVGSDNFNFLEVVATSDSSKSYVVAKKGGVTVSYDQ